LVFTEYGLKVSIYNLCTGKGVDINAPKFYTAASAGRGYSYRLHNSHLALLTRNGGKDVLSIHTPNTLEIVRSWVPQSIDAQGVCWSKDGKWLVVWESASQGHRLFVYTADGHLFKTWNGPFSADENTVLGAGIRGFEWSGNGAWIAVGDFSCRVTLLAVPSFGEAMSLVHPAAVDPRESLQVSLLQ
jgi:WD40 repeat protein